MKAFGIVVAYLGTVLLVAAAFSQYKISFYNAKY